MNISAISAFRPSVKQNNINTTTQNILPKYNQSCDTVSFKGNLNPLDFKPQVLKFVEEIRSNQKITEWLSANLGKDYPNATLPLPDGLSYIVSISRDSFNVLKCDFADVARMKLLGFVEFPLKPENLVDVNFVSIPTLDEKKLILFKNGKVSLNEIDPSGNYRVLNTVDDLVDPLTKTTT